jgi:hypothetical protein
VRRSRGTGSLDGRDLADVVVSGDLAGTHVDDRRSARTDNGSVRSVAAAMH